MTATLYLAALFVAAMMAPWSNSSMPNGAVEVVTTKFAFNEMQYRLYDKNGFCAVQETGCPQLHPRHLGRDMPWSSKAGTSQ